MNHRNAPRHQIFLTLATLSLWICAANSYAVSATAAFDGQSLRQRDSQEVLFDDAWKFFKGDEKPAKNPDFSDQAWRTVDLPHDWSIEGAFDPDLAACTAFLPGGIAWYRKSFILPSDIQNKTVRIRFDGVNNHSAVWCNGKPMGERPYGYSSFTYDLTSALNFDGKANIIAVRVDHEQFADSRWYAGSGIYRNVFLTISDKVHVVTDGTYLTTPKVTANSAELDSQTIVSNDSAVAVNLNIVTTIQDPAGQVVTIWTQQGRIPADEQKPFSSSGSISKPALWAPDHPAMYAAVTRISDGDKLLDQYTTPFGIRTFAFDPAKGFSINGQSMKLKGVCLHEDAGALGSAVPLQIWERRLKALQEAGCNAIRCSHNPPAPEFLDLCDRMGFLVMDEAFDEWSRGKCKWIVGWTIGKPGFDGYHSDFDKWADIDIRDMVKRDRNHPSIILWSIGNEIDTPHDPYQPNSPELPPIAARLIADVKSVDITRPVTAACASPATNLFKSLLDVEGYNYMEGLYARDHAAHPDRVLFGSENRHDLKAWQSVENNDYIAGQYLWTGVDYLGEAGVWPAHATPSGLLDLAGFKKDQFYFRQSLWTDAPMIHLSTSPIETGRNRATTIPAPEIYCYTNCDRVELFYDGQSLGEKTQTPAHIITWPLRFAAGKLHAVGHKGDAQVTFDMQHAGPAQGLTLHSDVPSLAFGELGLAQIEVDVTDADDNLVPDAAPLIACAISGPARLLGIENGNIRSTESYGAASHSAYHGRMMVYIQSLKAPGDVILSIAAPNLKGARLLLPVH